MRNNRIAIAAAVALVLFGLSGPVWAQGVSPREIQQLIANGQEQAALADLRAVLQEHPQSGVAWYLTAEAQDASGNEAAAGAALAKAERYAPGLPFANPAEVTALQARINGGAAPVRHRGVSPVLLGIIGFVFLFLILRMLFRPRGAVIPPAYPAAYGPRGFGPGPGPYPYGPGGMGSGLGSGLGGSLLGGLAAGAGFAAGERVIDGMFGNHNDPLNGNFPQDQNLGNQNFGNPIPGADDGLQGNPGWDDGSGGQDDNFDPNNGW